MRLALLLFILSAAVAEAQTADTTVYSLEYVIKYYRKNKGITKGMKEIVKEIKSKYVGERQQEELITLYKDAYEYSVSDKKILGQLIDSLIHFGLNEKVKEHAAAGKYFVENRFVGKKMRDFEFADKDGNLIKLSSLHDKFVVLELWATWCGPCIKEMPKIPAMRKGNASVEFYSISLDKSFELMKKFVEKKKYDWPIVYGGTEDANPELWSYLHIVAIPKYFILNKEGVVIKVTERLDKDYIGSLK